MMTFRGAPFLTSPVLASIPGLFHGFGKRGVGTREVLRAAACAGCRLITLGQVHSDAVLFFSRPPRTRRLGDALATDRPRLLVAVRTADCLPLLLADPARRVAAAVHCGWRGTSARLAEKTVAALERKYGCHPSSLRAALGPCIGPGCYEVGGDVREAFREAGLPLDVFRRLGRRGKFTLDLAAANEEQLLRAGLRRRFIGRVEACTHCRPDLCSYRRDPAQAGRMLNVVGFR